MLDNHDELTRARHAYAYAPFRLARAAESYAHAVLWAQPVRVQGPVEKGALGFAGHSAWDLDQYHHQLLRSETDADVLLGVASVTFWGFGQGKDGRFTTARALARARIVAGLGKRGADDAPAIVGKVRAVCSLLDRGDRQGAVLEAMSLKHHGLAFATKLLAFSSPETECVYDEVISLRLQSSSDIRLKDLHVSPVGKYRLAEKAAAYEGWAQLCTAKALELNHDRGRWTDWDGAERPWRAVDVERAFFGLGRGA